MRGLYTLVVAIGLFSQSVFAATPSITPAVVDQNEFPGVQFCTEIPIVNSGTPGFGPYLRLTVPDGVSLDSASLFGIAITPTNAGVFPAAPANQVDDTIISQPVTGPEGDSLFLLQPPIGSVTTGGPPLNVAVCFTIDTAAPINVPMNLQATPVYEFGDTATGANGPIIGVSDNFNITPVLVEFIKENTAPEDERPPGPSWPVTYDLTVDIAETKTIDNLVIADILPANFILDAASVTVTGGTGCTVTLPAGGSTTLTVNCTSGTGLAGMDNEIVVSYTGYYDDVLDEASCATDVAINNASLNGSFNAAAIAPLTVMDNIQIEHVSMQKSASPFEDQSPGDVITFTLNMQVTDHGVANDLQLKDILPDGYTFDPASVTSSFGAIAATVTDNAPSNGATTLDFNVTGVTGNIAAGTGLTISYQAVIDANYFNGDPILASDSLTNTIDASYGLVAGANSCVDTSSARVTIIPTVTTKQTITVGPYQPGDTVTYRLTMNIPSGDTKNIVFTDFFPLPALDASTIGAGAYGPAPEAAGGAAAFDIRRAPDDTLGLTPTSMIYTAATNSLEIVWPDVTTGTAQVLSVDIDIEVTTEPFADNLKLSNLLQTSSENSTTSTSTAVAPVLVTIQAPVLVVTKGVLTSDQGTINPAPGTLPVDGNVVDVDAGDTVRYQVTIENTGGGKAYDVTLTDSTATGLINCILVAPAPVVNGAGTTLAFSGGFTGSALAITLIDFLPPDDGLPPAGENIALVTYQCEVAIGVQPEEVITNEASVTFASTTGGTIFPTLTDDATATIKVPSIDKTVLGTAPDVDGNPVTIAIGETIQYQVDITIPEGTSPATVLTDLLDAGLEFMSFDSISATAGLSTSHAGGFTGVNTDATGLNTNTASFPFDTITNTNTDNNTADIITILYTVKVLDGAANADGNLKNNRARFIYPNGWVQDRAPNRRIREPLLTMNKSVSPTTADAGDTITYTIVVTNTGTSPAFDVAITDLLGDPSLVLDDMTVTTTAGIVTTGNGAGDLTVLVDSIAGGLAVGGSVTVTFDVVLGSATPAGTSLTNTAEVAYSSIPGATPGDVTDGRVYTPVTDSATVTAYIGMASKVVLPATSTEQSAGTSGQGNAGLVDLTMGEEVTFEITMTVAEGLSNTLVITDTLPNDAAGHLDIVGGSLISVGGDLSGVNLNAPTITIAPSNVITFDFGSVTNLVDGISDAEDQIVVRVTAVVKNAAVNAGLEVLTNNVLMLVNTGISTTASADFEIVEPILTINKSSPITTADAGDTVTFTIAIDNLAVNGSTANAFDVALNDAIPAGYTYAGGLTLVSGPTPDAGTLIENSGTIQANWGQFDLAQTAVISYQVTLDNTVAPQQMITNTANVGWSSMPGANIDERAGADAEQHVITVSSPGMVKNIISTSEPTTMNSVNGPEEDITIGEEVTYHFTVTIPEGTSFAAEAIDQLPAGMNVVSSQVISLGGAQLTAPSVAVGDAGTISGGNTVVTWALGDVVNVPGGGSGDADDQIVFEVVAVLMDVGANASGGNDIVNTASFTTGSTTIMDTALIDIVEPVVNVAKDTVPSGLTADAGDVLDYQITLTHDAASNSDAFNFAVTDVLPTPGTEWINDGTVTSTCGPVSVNSTAAPSIVFSFATLPLVSGSCTINYQVQVNAAVMPNLTYQNTATAQYTSTNTVGVQTRTYTPMANADFVTPDPTLIKVSAASSLGDTGDTVQNGLLPDLAIGETINFDMTVIVPEGVTTNAVLVDTLPAGLEIVSATINTAGGNISTTLANVTAVPGSNTATFDFGTVTNVADGGVSPADYINVTVVALVSDIGTNVDLATLSNSASFTFGAGGAANTLTDTADVEIVEPNLALAKTMGPMVDHVVPITLTFSNTGGHAPAYDIVITDLLDPAIWDTASITPDSIPVGFTFSEAAGLVTIASNPAASLADQSISIDEVIIFTFHATLRDDVVLPATLPNTATVTEVNSLPGVVAGERDFSDITANASLALPLLNSDKAYSLVADSNGSGGASPSEVLLYTITIVNSGNAAATNVVLTDTPDGNVTLNNGSVATDIGVVTSGNTGESTVGVNVGTIPVGGTATISYQVTINSPLATGVVSLANQGSIASSETPDFPTNDPTTGLDDDPTIVPVDSAPDLLITKTDGGVNTTPSGVVIYTLGYDNIGTQDATNVKITEIVPANSTFNAANSSGTWTCTPNINAGSTCVQDVGAVNVADAAGSVAFAVLVDSPLAVNVTGLTNAASIADDGTNGADLDSNNNGATDTTPITAAAVLSLTKTDGGITTTAGGSVSYVLTYTNSGDQDAEGVVITETVPANSSFDPAVSTGTWTCTPDNNAGSVCTQTIGNVAGNGGTGNTTFAVTVVSPVPAGINQLDNAAVISDDIDPGIVDDTAIDNTPINAAPDVLVTKVDSGAVAPGDTINYTVSYDNIGTQHATGVVITETVPADTTFDSANNAAGWACVANTPGSLCTLVLGGLNVGAGGSVNFPVIIDNPLASGVTAINNSVNIADDGSNGVDPVGNNTSNVSTPLASAIPDLAVTKDDGGVSVNAGDTITYVINYSNVGAQNAVNVEITETVPANTTFNGTSTAGWVCLPDNNAGSTCTYPLASLNGGGASGTINFIVDVDNPLAAGVSAINNSISIKDDESNGIDPDTTNNADTDDTPVTAAPDLNVLKTAQSATVTAGGSLIYDVVYQNVGTQNATGVEITETVPANTTFDAANSPGWTCVANTAGSVCTYAVGSLTVAEGVQTTVFAVTLESPLSAGVEFINNTISIQDDGSNGVDPTPLDNTDTETTSVGGRPDLSITKTDGDIASGPGQTIVYQLAYENLGNQNASGVVVDEIVPANTSFNAGASTGVWSCSDGAVAGTACQHVIGGLIVGASGSITFAVTVDNPLANGVNKVENTVEISDDGTSGVDTDLTNNTATDETSLELKPPVGFKVGEFDATDSRLIHWTILWFNPNNDRDLPIAAFDDIPSNTLYVSGSATCVATGISSCTTPVYDAVTNQLTLSAILGEDEGAASNSTAGDLDNEIVIQFDTRVIGNGNILIENQAMANWDKDNNGDPENDAAGGQVPILTDDPLTQGIFDPTKLYMVYPIPILNIWTLLLLFLGLLFMPKLVRRSASGVGSI